jgi:hypothetical protein
MIININANYAVEEYYLNKTTMNTGESPIWNNHLIVINVTDISSSSQT